MKKLIIPFIENADDHQEFKSLPEHKIDQISWADYPYLPDANFKIAYTDHCIFLKYNVSEKYLKAIYKETNEPVYKDSCVEFFISFDQIHYYNFEFNSIGTALVGYGPAIRDLRKRLPVDLMFIHFVSPTNYDISATI
jgi:hypothetical protein